jgi:Tfp pilus assembly protein PilN
MTQLNLLPDVKLEYIKAKRMRHLVTSVSILVCGVAVLILVLLLGASAVQKKHLSDLNKDIASETSQLKNKPQVEKILTVQNDIGSLNDMHAQEPAAARIFDFLNQTTPDKVSINNLTVDLTTQTMSITGNTDMLSTVNKYVDTLKFTTYTAGDDTVTKAFSDVVLSEFGVNTDTSSATANQAASYTITLQYDPAILDSTKDVKLTVPSLTTTRINVDAPSDLFQAAPPKTGAGGN